MEQEKTLVLCFIHGFKGDDDTFGNFPSYFGGLLQNSLSDVEVKTITYPKYETRGDLQSCVSRFREWLQNQVIDIEVANSTPAPMVEPSVHVVLVGHSMGGIVAAESVLAIVNEEHISTAGVNSISHEDEKPFLFPYIIGILAFDTPYLGINPGVFAHNAESHWNTTSSAIAAASSLAGAFGYGKSSTSSAKSDTDAKAKSSAGIDDMTKALAASSGSTSPSSGNAGRNWTNIAMIAGAVGAIGGGGAAAYLKRNDIAAGMTWITSHLEFVGCLSRAAELRQRLERISSLIARDVIGFADIYTALGAGASGGSSGGKAKTSYAAAALGDERTFCVLPKRGEEMRKYWTEATNEKAGSEVGAHMNMFDARENPLWHEMCGTARDMLVDWVGNKPWHTRSGNGGGVSGDDWRSGGGNNNTTMAAEAEAEGTDVADERPQFQSQGQSGSYGGGSRLPAAENPWQ